MSKRTITRAATAALAILTLINFLNYIDRYVMAAVVSGVGEEFGLNRQGEGLLGSMFMIVYTVASPFSGWLGDRTRRKYLVAGGVLLWSLATVGSGLVSSYGGLLLMRALVGIGEAGYATVAPAIIGDLYKKDRRSRMLAYFYMATPVGSALGFVLGGVVAEHSVAILEAVGLPGDMMSGWRLAFLIAGAPGLLMSVLALFMHEPLRGATEQGEWEEPTSGPVRSAWGTLLRTPGWRDNTIGATLMTFAIGGLAFWMPTFLQDVHGMDQGAAGTAFGGVTVVAGIIGTLVGGTLGDRAFRRGSGGFFRVSGMGLLIGAPFALLAPLMGSIPLTLALVFVAELFLFLNTGPLNAALVGCVAPRYRATAVAMNVLFIHALGDAISPYLLGAAADLSEGALGSSMALRLAVAVNALPIAVGGAYLLRSAKRYDRAGNLSGLPSSRPNDEQT